MATGDEARSQLRDENQDVEDDVDQEERDLGDRGSAMSLGNRERSKDAVPGEDSGKSGGSKRGTPGTKEVRDRESPARQQPEGAEPKKVRLTDARRKLAEVERRTAEYRAKLLEEIMNDAKKNAVDDRTLEEGELDLGQGSQDGDAQHRKDRPRDTRDTPTRKGKEGIKFLREDRDRPVNPLLLDSGASRPSVLPVNFITESDDRDGVNVTTRQRGAAKKVIQDAVMEDAQEGSNPPAESDHDKVYGKPREEAPVDKVTSAKKKFRYQIPILADLEIDHTLSQLLVTMVSVAFQTMLQASPRLLKGLRQLLTRQRVEVAEEPGEREEGKEQEPPREVANLQRALGDLKDLEKAFTDIRLSLPDREGGEVMRAPPGTKLSFHALPVGKPKVQIGTHRTDTLVDGRAEITLIRKDFATIAGCPIIREVTGSVRGASGEIPFSDYVTKCAVKTEVRESIWSFQRMTVMDEMDHDVILGRPWCANVEMIGMHRHDDTYMVDIEDPVSECAVSRPSSVCQVPIWYLGYSMMWTSPSGVAFSKRGAPQDFHWSTQARRPAVQHNRPVTVVAARFTLGRGSGKAGSAFSTARRASL
ncbi:hypothetical protein CBR_g19554 [Chara braunii]|uniref:Uncharacterized protein n=1 Tax=Chara braunii TaxID=69332 RepID=A0A388KYC4_CHABU|nr:hypothetical protein CBR_g19554 [Chara braunii]|eukprot:GBG75041.1 hypothetical protein CBR_g19554 [Chara braunii]